MYVAVLRPLKRAEALRFAAPRCTFARMTERRFSEDEVAAIFERAAQAPSTGQRQLPSGEGMTLAQLQEIGREVGIAPESIAHAARSLQVAGQPTSRRFLGLPIGVGHTVDLGRRLSDDEWERFVVDLRETFDARGRVKQEGSLRHWSNGNLQALLEPTETGHRIRLRTMHGGSRALMTGGLVMMALSGVAVLIGATGGNAGAIDSPGLVALMGAGMFGYSALRLPGWARIRRRQMEELSARIAEVSPPVLPRASAPPDTPLGRGTG